MIIITVILTQIPMFFPLPTTTATGMYNNHENTTTNPDWLGQYDETADGIRAAYEGVPLKVVDSSRSDLETFEAVCDFAEEVGRQKEERLGESGMRAFREMVRIQRLYLPYQVMSNSPGVMGFVAAIVGLMTAVFVLL